LAGQWTLKGRGQIRWTDGSDLKLNPAFDFFAKLISW
jgi:hypothetical protein